MTWDIKMSSKSLSINSDEYNQTSFSSNRTNKEDEVRSHFSDTFCRCLVSPSAGEQACPAGASR